jgi:hypothetical protein
MQISFHKQGLYWVFSWKSSRAGAT